MFFSLEGFEFKCELCVMIFYAVRYAYILYIPFRNKKNYGNSGILRIKDTMNCR